MIDIQSPTAEIRRGKIESVMAGFPNPLPDTLHLYLVGFSVYTCVFDHAYACTPGNATWPDVWPALTC